MTLSWHLGEIIQGTLGNSLIGKFPVEDYGGDFPGVKSRENVPGEFPDE